MDYYGYPISSEVYKVVDRAILFIQDILDVSYGDKENLSQFPIDSESILLGILDEELFVDKYIKPIGINTRGLIDELFSRMYKLNYVNSNTISTFLQQCLLIAYNLEKKGAVKGDPYTNLEIQVDHLIIWASGKLLRKGIDRNLEPNITLLTDQCKTIVGMLSVMEELMPKEELDYFFKMKYELFGNTSFNIYSERPSLELEFDIPEHLSEEETLEYIKQGVLLADKAYRAHGGSGLQIKEVKVPAFDSVTVNA